MMPTIAAMTGASLPKGAILDGVSFASRLSGRKGKPREFVYIYNEPIPGPIPKPTIFARDQRWKLYSDGRLYDISSDALEQHPINEGPEGVRRRLQAVLDSMPSEGQKIYRPITDPMAGRG